MGKRLLLIAVIVCVVLLLTFLFANMFNYQHLKLLIWIEIMVGFHALIIVYVLHQDYIATGGVRIEYENLPNIQFKVVYKLDDTVFIKQQTKNTVKKITVSIVLEHLRRYNRQINQEQLKKELQLEVKKILFDKKINIKNVYFKEFLFNAF
ncbi:MAG: hypothetical protein ACOCQR_00820 [bacterium]